MNEKEIRELFPVTKHTIYVNHAAVSPYSEWVKKEMENYISQRGDDRVEDFISWVEKRDQVRRKIAQLIRAETDNIAFVKNTSEGLSILASGLEWKPGDHIILMDNEFPANIYPFLNLRKFGVEIDFVKNQKGFIKIEDIKKAINKKTRLLSISFVGFLNGFKHDLVSIGEICKKNQIIFCVDGIQGIGALGIDVGRCQIDFLANGAHKWLMSPQGAGFIYLNENLLKRINLSHVGWLSVKDSWNFFDYDLNLIDNAQRFEIATENWLGIYGMNGALDLFSKIGFKRIEGKVLAVTDRLIEHLQQLDVKIFSSLEKQHRSGIVSFMLKEREKTKNLFQTLMNEKIWCSLREGLIRISPHIYNNAEEMDRIAEVIGQNLTKF